MAQLPRGAGAGIVAAIEGGMTTKRKARKKMGADQTGVEKPKRRKKLLRLDDLIPKKDVAGGRHVLFGARDSSDDQTGR